MGEVTVPFSLIIDDSGPVNMYSFHNPARNKTRFVPVAFLRRFAAVARDTGLKGKFSVVPFPGCLGRLDQGLPGYPAAELGAFLDIVRSELAADWDLTPEMLTHWMAMNPRTLDILGQRENEWAEMQIAATLTEYIALALAILKNVGLAASGVTSPWDFGVKVEAAYAEAVEAAMRNVFGARRSWYFLHLIGERLDLRPTLMRWDASSGRGVVSVPACAGDCFWDACDCPSVDEARRRTKDAVERLIGHDGAGGRLAALAEAGQPIVLVTHWQSLFSDGSGAGLDILAEVIGKLNDAYAGRMRWVKTSEVAFPVFPCP